MVRGASVLALLAACTAHAASDNPETLAERSQATASAVLDRAVNALGGIDELHAIEVVRVRVEGESWPRLQLSTPEPPFDGGVISEDVLLDTRNNSLLFEQRNSTPGFENPEVVVIKGSEGTIYNLRAHTYRPFPSAPSIEQQFAPHYRRLPHLLLRQALERANTLRSLGQDTFEGKPHDVVTFLMGDGQQVALYVDVQSALISKHEVPIVDPLAGDDVSEVAFGDYTRSGNTRVPRTLLTREAGQLTARAQLTVDVNPAVTDQSFAGPSGHVPVGPSRTAPQSIERLADGVFVIQNVAGPVQNTLLVEFADYVVAVEAPGSSAGTERVIARIKTAVPGKPIRYVVMTHHHGDHVAGLRSFIAEGATVITTPGNRSLVQSLAAAPHTDRLAKQSRRPEILLTERGRRVLTDGARTLEIIDVGPNAHAREMLIAYLPKERIVFQADMFGIPSNEASFGPPRPPFVSFANKLKELRLAVDRIASVHGRTATIEEFRQRMRESADGT